MAKVTPGFFLRRRSADDLDVPVELIRVERFGPTG
jgi:hypothetical protein